MVAFEGKTAFVVGGGTGIGRATAELIAERGGTVVIAGRREEPLRNVAEANPQISYLQLDVGDISSHEAALAQIIKRHGRLDVLVNVAAATAWKPFEDHSFEEFARVVHVNLVATAMLIQRAVPHLAKSKGNVVNVSSVAGKYTGMPPQNLSAYSVSKAGLNQLTRILATELGGKGIRVNAVAPGVTAGGDMAAGVFDNLELVARNTAETPLGRIGQSIDIARVIAFVASEEAAWVTGQIIDATGGYHLAL